MINKIRESLDSYPMFLTSVQLCKLGLYKTPDLCYLARRRGDSPDYVQLGRKILYPKESVIKWVEARLKSGSESNGN